MYFPSGMIKCSVLLRLCWACGRPSKVMTALSETWESPKLIPKKSVSGRVIAKYLFIVALLRNAIKYALMADMSVWIQTYASIFSLCCFWLQIAHICHLLLLWQFFFEGVIELWNQLNMASGRRLIKIQEELKTVTTTQTACFRLSAIKMDFGWTIRSDLASDTVHPISSRFRSVSYVDVYEFGISLTAAGSMSPCPFSQAA